MSESILKLIYAPNPHLSEKSIMERQFRELIQDLNRNYSQFNSRFIRLFEDFEQELNQLYQIGNSRKFSLKIAELKQLVKEEVTQKVTSSSI